MFGPYGTQIIGEMGADVIKVESPEGDIGRQTGAARSPGMSAAHLMKGRNKRSIVLDLKQPAGLEALERLTKTADVFVHNIRPQAARKLGIAYDAVASWKPDIVYAEAIGFGEDGPYAERLRLATVDALVGWLDWRRDRRRLLQWVGRLGHHFARQLRQAELGCRALGRCILIGLGCVDTLGHRHGGGRLLDLGRTGRDVVLDVKLG